jgi:hypothetical protein
VTVTFFAKELTLLQSGISQFVQQSKGKWDQAEPATEADLHNIQLRFGARVPKDYLDFLRISNGGEGSLPVQPWWFVIWAAETIIERWIAYEMEEYIPGYLAFGSNGGGEAFVFNLNAATPERVYIMPFIGMEPGQEILVASSFKEFVRLFGKNDTGNDGP